MRRSAEVTLVRLSHNGSEIGALTACDVHGNGRSNKAWLGEVYVNGIRREVDLPNLKAVDAFARENGLTAERLKQDS